MKKMIKFAVSRYAYFLSYVAAFLAGVSVVVPAVYMLLPLSLAVVFGSMSAYYRAVGDMGRKKSPAPGCKVTEEFCSQEQGGHII